MPGGVTTDLNNHQKVYSCVPSVKLPNQFKVVTDNRNHNGKILLRVTPFKLFKSKYFIKNELVQQYTALTRSFLTISYIF